MRAICIPLCLLALVLGACGRDPGSDGAARPTPGTERPSDPGFGTFATKNTTRVAADDPVAAAAAVAQAVYPGGAGDRPGAVAIVDDSDWRLAIAASVLAAAPIRAPILLSGSDELPETTESAISTTDPRGARTIGRAEVIRVGEVPGVDGRRSVAATGADAFATAAAIDTLLSGAARRRSDTVIVTGSEQPEFAMPAASLAAKTGAPVLFTERDTVPAATRAAIAAHGRPRIVVVGPPSTIGPRALATLRRLGRIVPATRADDPMVASIDVARFADSGFGWGIVDPGHGLVFARSASPFSAGAAALLSASGTYGPLLLLERRDELPDELVRYLRLIQPGYTGDPSRGVYNHAWIIGDQDQVSPDVQSEIDALLEIRRARSR